ncbi:sigma-54 dependent transcriptional regulator [bacterium]|nr:sigma-54 dependent transcriptional regulator [bacterium]
MNRVLIIDDEQSLLTTLEVLFSREGFEVATAPGGLEGLELLRAGDPPDLLITDIRMPEVDGIQVLREAKKIDPFLPVVIITAQAEKQGAIDACNEGAYYFLEKPFENRRLIAICREALEFGRADRRYAVRRRELTSTAGPEPPVGQAPAFVRAMDLARRAAASDSTILIQGESGTGKELVARFIYQSSQRANRPFVTVNCGALPETLLESELFGHVKGSFTGAISNKDGLFKVASGGTIFLDEVGDTSLAFQVKLLRVLQEREITPVGSTEPVTVDVRVIAATNKDLEAEVESGQFRRDLFYRLNVIPITVPPLRERAGDIPALIDHFLRRLGRDQGHETLFTPGALEVLSACSWKGNIRELENVIEQLTVTGPANRIGEEDLPARLRTPQPAPLAAGGPKPTPTLEAVETAYIEWVMNQVGGSRKEAARVLGIDPSTLYRKLTR